MRHVVALRGAIRHAMLLGVPRPRSLALILAVAATASLAGCPATGDGPGEGEQDGAVDSCDVEAPTDCTDPDSSYADVEPIIARRCLSCHDGGGPQWALADYAHVADWAAEVRGMVLSCTMPPPDSGIRMPVEEREAILLWIRCGHPP